MRNPKALRQRIVLLYIAFFVVVAASILYGTLSNSFMKGYLDGQNLSERIVENYLERQRPIQTKVLYALPNLNRSLYIDIPELHLPEGVTATARVGTIDLTIESDAEGKSLLGVALGLTGSTATLIYSYLALFGSAAIVILIFLTIESLRRSLRSGNVFERRNIGRTRAIGIIIIAISILKGLGQHTIVRQAEQLLAGSHFRLDTSFQIDFWNILLGILILFIAEIFAIGYRMQEEQRLTI